MALTRRYFFGLSDVKMKDIVKNVVSFLELNVQAIISRGLLHRAVIYRSLDGILDLRKVWIANISSIIDHVKGFKLTSIEYLSNGSEHSVQFKNDTFIVDFSDNKLCVYLSTQCLVPTNVEILSFNGDRNLRVLGDNASFDTLRVTNPNKIVIDVLVTKCIDLS